MPVLNRSQTKTQLKIKNSYFKENKMEAFNRKLILVIASFFIMSMTAGFVFAHCQVPCGIYDDHSRINQMLEDSITIIKASNQIADLAGKIDAQSQNQMIRWVMNKEKHAQNIISTISDYFLTQRVKASQKDYTQRLKDHHGVIVAAMKAKQNADVSFGLELQKKIQALEKYYPGHP